MKLHPEASQFYFQVQEWVQSLTPLIDDQDHLLSTFPYYLFTHHRLYPQWKQDTEEIYRSTKSFDDLLYTNQLFLQKLIPMTYYHLTPIYDMQTDVLQKITEKGVFTTNGQSSACENGVLQKPYLTGLVYTDVLERLMPKLLKSREYYFHSYNLQTKEEVFTIPYQEGKYVVTLQDKVPFTWIKKDGVFNDWLLIESNEVIPKEVKQDILEQTSLIQIVGKDYCKGNVELYLLKSIK
jgi:hypothetical protein